MNIYIFTNPTKEIKLKWKFFSYKTLYIQAFKCILYDLVVKSI